MISLANNRIVSLIQNTLAVAFKGNERVRSTWWRHRAEIEAAYERIEVTLSAGDAARAGRCMRELMQAQRNWLLGE